MEKLMTNNSTTIQNRVLSALQNGSELTSAQIKSKFGAGNPGAVIQALRFNGFPVYLNNVKTSKGIVRKYRLGTASRAVIAAGYKAMAKSKVA